MTGILHIVLARKPVEGTVAENCLLHGCGGLNIDGCRIGMESGDREAYKEKRRSFAGARTNYGKTVTLNTSPVLTPEQLIANSRNGRFPANLVIDRSDDVLVGFPDVHGAGKSLPKQEKWGYNLDNHNVYGTGRIKASGMRIGDSGSASRFFFNYSEQESDEWTQ